MISPAAPPAKLRSIRGQVLTFAGLICLTVLITAGGLLFVHHLGQTRARLADSLRTIAQMTADHAAGTLAFRHPAEAGKVLASLRHDPLVIAAVLYDNRDQRFVSYGSEVPASFDPTQIDPNEALLVDVVYDDVVFGRLLVITKNRAELNRTAFTWASVYGGAFVLTTLLAFALATAFQRAVAAPLTTLAHAASAVTVRNDYSVRAPAGGSAEVAALSEAFNTMLAEIGRRDAELARQLTALDKEMHEREAAEESLHQNTRELLRLSREAGMAEVATGVLHNIGNALNSINVSTELLADHLRSRAGPATLTLRDFFVHPPAKAAPVFASHAAGPEVLSAAVVLSTQAADYLTSANQELAALRTGVAHLKEIVATQQSLAKAARHKETFEVREAIQEALLLDKTLGHATPVKLRIEQTYEGESHIHTDRSGLVQVMVNLLANARAAVANTPAPLIRIRVVAPASTARLSVSVIDNGIGIRSDQLVSIFSYGFTTKAGGHGFGLHNSANTARLLGGALLVRSDGPGRGATFTLEIPRSFPTLTASSAHDA